MTTDDLEIFLHAEGVKPKVVKAALAEALGEVLAREGIDLERKSETHVFIGECEDSRRDVEDNEDGEDEHEPIDIRLTIEALDLGRHRHVHVHGCRRVAVEVNFGGKTKRRKFSPAATVGVVTEWARRKFKLDPASAGEYVLQICGSSDQPRSDVHLGELTDCSQCSLCFDLVKEVTPQG